MQSDPGAGVPHTGGNDDEVWRELVSRLEESEDAFMKQPRPDAGPARVEPHDSDAPKGVIDFDPLGVWQQSGPADGEPSEPATQASAAWGPRDHEAPDEGEFVPEELPSLSQSDPAIMASWIGAAGGPLFLVFSAIFWRQAPLLLIVGVIIAFIAGTGYLFYRLPSHRDDDGDGAVV